jgi:hypothetical protein
VRHERVLHDCTGDAYAGGAPGGHRSQEGVNELCHAFILMFFVFSMVWSLASAQQASSAALLDLYMGYRKRREKDDNEAR